LRPRAFLDRIFNRPASVRQAQRVESPDLSTLGVEGREMVQGILGLSRTTVKEIMVPRIDVVSLSTDTPTADLARTIAESGHSRFPVYQGTIDNIVGIVHAKDLLRLVAEEGTAARIGPALRKPYFVPESKKLDSLLREFKRRKAHIAVAVDEYGGTSGVVTMEDILEEIVGEIQDEFDDERAQVEEIGDKVYLCDARVSLEDFNRKTCAGLPEEDFDTLGGFVFALFGRIPSAFDKASYGPVDFVVQEMDGHKIVTVKAMLSRMAQAGEGAP
jgi:CBS domain containing-hemolysin-like protein